MYMKYSSFTVLIEGLHVLKCVMLMLRNMHALLRRNDTIVFFSP